jgi:hypothetical protein
MGIQWMVCWWVLVVELHPQLNNIGHPVDGALVGAGFIVALSDQFILIT